MFPVRVTPDWIVFSEKKEMRKYNMFILLLLIPGFIQAQENIQTNDTHESQKKPKTEESDHKDMMTLAGNYGHSGGYGAIFFKGTHFKDQTLLITGFRGAWVVNRSFGIGVDINGIIPTAKYAGVDPNGLNQAVLVGGYGGMLLEPILWSNNIVHLTFPMSIGAGWLGYIEDWENNHYYYNGEIYDEDVFWYFEPGVNVEVNVASFFRVGIGITKRFTQDLQMLNASATAFDKLNYGITLKFGGF